MSETSRDPRGDPVRGGDGGVGAGDDRDDSHGAGPAAADSPPNGITFSLAHSHGDYIRHLHAFLVTLDESVTIATLDPHPYYGGNHATPGGPADSEDHLRDTEAHGYTSADSNTHTNSMRGESGQPGPMSR